MNNLPVVEDWINLPVRIMPEDIVTVYLDQEEIDSITEYGDRMFDKETIDKMPSQWASSKGKYKINPNTTGIKGEYAGNKYFLPDDRNLVEFLDERPWRMSDMGDAILTGKTAKIFDYKTRTRDASVTDLVTSDGYMAEMDNKFLQEKYKYLQAFIFCVNQPKANRILLMGWLAAEDFFSRSQLIPKGDPVPYSRFPYSADTRCVPYRRLKPMSELQGLTYHPITQNMTIQMRQDFEKKELKDVKDYLL